MDIKITREVLENERDIGILKGQLEELKGNLKGIQDNLVETNTHSSNNEQEEYVGIVVFLFLKELIGYLENIKTVTETKMWENKDSRKWNTN